MDAPDSEPRWIAGRTSDGFGARFTTFGATNGCKGTPNGGQGTNAVRADSRPSRPLRRHE
jgi:hypothetical protein